MKHIIIFALLFIIPVIASAEDENPDCNWRMLHKSITIAQSSDKPGVKFHCKNENHYYFIISGLKPGGKLNPLQVIILDPHKRRNSLQIKTSEKIDANGNMMLSAKFKGYERSGTWELAITRKDETKIETFFQYAPTKPLLMVVRQKLNEEGVRVYTLIGTGWKPGEELAFTASGPTTLKQELSKIHADEYGVSRPFKVPFVKKPADGKYVFKLKNGDRTASLKITCHNTICTPERAY